MSVPRQARIEISGVIQGNSRATEQIMKDYFWMSWIQGHGRVQIAMANLLQKWRVKSLKGLMVRLERNVRIKIDEIQVTGIRLKIYLNAMCLLLCFFNENLFEF